MQFSTTHHLGLVISENGGVTVTPVPTRKPQIGEIVVSLLQAGICGTDLEIISRTRHTTAAIPGHEGIAEVMEVGPGVSLLCPGQKVVFNPVNPKDQDDVLGYNAEGLFQQRLLVSQSSLERGMVLPFDERIPLICGPLIEPLSTVVYGQQLVEQVCQPASIAIIGAGSIGLLNALYARSHGCPTVFLVDISPTRLAWAVERQIIQNDEAFLNSASLETHILARTAQRGVDAVYLCTPHPPALTVLQQALRFIRPGGCIDLVGGFADGDSVPELPGVDLNSIRRANFCGLHSGKSAIRCTTLEGKQVWLTGHRGSSAEHINRAMQSLREKPTWYASVISHIASPISVPSVLQHLMGETTTALSEEYVKIIIDFTKTNSHMERFELSSFLGGNTLKL